MPYSSHAHSRPVASLLGTLSSLRTNLDVLLIPFYSKLTMPDVDLNGKLAVVTGANSGIGFEAARALATMGAHVILACRSESKGEEARKKIVESTGSPKVELEILDCGKFASVHAFLERWEKREIKQVDILINNAGGMTSTATLTEDGFEQTYQSNHLAHVLLTHMLLIRNHISPSGRIVSVSSAVFNVSDALEEQNAGGADVLSRHQNQAGAEFKLGEMMQLYARSKASQAIWTMVLQRKLAEREDWRDVTAHSCHPGVVNSSIWQQPSSNMGGLAANMLRRIATAFGISTEEGAVTPVWLAVAPVPASEKLRGMFWDRMRWKWVKPWSMEEDRQERLWDLWCRETGAPLR